MQEGKSDDNENILGWRIEKYKYVVVLSYYNGKILLSRHKSRSTWETQGGHIEENETPLEAAKRELFEESGAMDYSMVPSRFMRKIVCRLRLSEVSRQ